MEKETHSVSLGIVDFDFEVEKGKSDILSEVLNREYATRANVQYDIISSLGLVDDNDYHNYSIKVTDKRIIDYLASDNAVVWIHADDIIDLVA